MCTNDFPPAVAIADPSFPLPDGAIGAGTGGPAADVEAPGLPAAFAAARSDACLALVAFRKALACAVCETAPCVCAGAGELVDTPLLLLLAYAGAAAVLSLVGEI